MGSFGVLQELENGIVQRRSGVGLGESQTMMEWVEWVTKLGSEGVRVEQCEWRQTEFTPPEPDRAAESVVHFEMHLAWDREMPVRSIFEGVLWVGWQREGGADGRPRIDAIEVREFSLTERSGSLWFGKNLRVVPKPGKGRKEEWVTPVIVRDLNRDGLPEIILGGQNLLLRNKGSFRFAQEELFHKRVLRLRAGIVEDFDGDGYLDLIGVAEDGKAWMQRGKEGGRFGREAVRPWMMEAPGERVLSAGDVDGDGDLDLWFGRYQAPYVGGQFPTPYYDANDGLPFYLLLNDGTGQFTDGTVEAGLEGLRHRRVRSGSLVDLDRDGDLDLVVVSEFAGLDFHRNDGEGRFVEATEELFQERRAFGMGHVFGNFDRDGTTDLFMVGRSTPVVGRLHGRGLLRGDLPEHGEARLPMTFGNRLYQGRGRSFVQTGLNDGCARAGWAWGAAAIDVDLDGDDELYVANGNLSGESGMDYSFLLLAA